MKMDKDIIGHGHFSVQTPICKKCVIALTRVSSIGIDDVTSEVWNCHRKVHRKDGALWK